MVDKLQSDAASPNRPIEDLRTAFVFLTRLPVSGGEAPLSRAVWAFPVAGAAVGAVGALAFWAVHALGLGAWPAAFAALAATALATGALHEDGLADAADGLGAGGSVERRIGIMRDNRTGVFGVLALVLATGLKASALAALAGPGAAAAVLIAAHAAARCAPPLLMAALPAASTSGLAARAGAPSRRLAAGAVICAGAVAVLACGIGAGLAILLAALAAAAGVGLLLRRMLGGHNGDTLGLAEQVAEIACLLTGAALLAQAS